MNDKKCDACGCELKGGYSIGGTLLCRTCNADVLAEIDATRAAGKQPNALGIARRMYREKFDTGNLLIKDIPAELVTRLKIEAAKTGKTIRELFIERMSK